MGNKSSSENGDTLTSAAAPTTSSSASSQQQQQLSNSSSATSIAQSASASAACQYCGVFNTDADKHSAGHYTCKRCGGLLPYFKQTKRGPGSTDVQLPLQRLHILPFVETLPPRMQHCTESELLQQYVQPYFQNNRPFVNVGSRLQINGVDCKVVACHPPAGVVTQNTQIRCIGKYLSALNHVTRLHVLPTKASVQSLPQREQDRLKPAELFSKYIRPYFSDESRHINTGDTFMSQGIQFKCIAATPDNGTVDNNTEIFTDGPYLNDIKKIHVLPIYESLPNNEKHITAAESFQRYLAPFFLGRMQYVSKSDTLDVIDVQYKVIGIQPDNGIVTLETEIFSVGEPLRAEDIRRAQEEEDARMARQMAQQDMSFGRGGRSRNNPANFMPVQLGGDPEELRMRMAEILRMMPANDLNRPVIQRLHDQLLMLPFIPSGSVGLDPHMMRIMQSAHAVQQPVNNGANQSQLDSLPTRTFHKPTAAAAAAGGDDGEDKEHLTCMVCLAEYDEGDELRTLPCFHTFHSNCIDMWLKRRAECPVCRHSVK